MNEIQYKPSLSSSYDDLRDQVEKQKIKIEELEKLLTCCTLDTDPFHEKGYPKTANDYLSLLSAYWNDYLPDEVELGDEYFAAWEKQSRSVIERLTNRTCLWKRVAGWEDEAFEWDTGCGDSFVGTVFSFEASDHGFCQSCGGKIVLEP